MSKIRKISLVTAIALVGLFLSLAYIAPQNASVRADWTYPSGYNPHGGYVDRLTFIVYPSEDIATALLALQSGEVYSYDERIPHQSVAELEANPAITVTSIAGAIYRQLTMQCSRFPTNISGYRVALSYALDKTVVVANARGGFAQPMDNPIPLPYTFWTYEDQMSEHFYTEDITSANATLDAWHIIDDPTYAADPAVPDTEAGWRFFDVNENGVYDDGVDKRGDLAAPDGMAIELWASAGYDPAIQAVTAMVAGMEKCGLHGSVVEVDFDALIAGLGTGEYSLGCFSWNINPPGEPFLLYDFFNTAGDNNAFFYRYNNTEFDYNTTMMLAAPTRLEARNWAWNACAILMEEMPMIVCYNDEYTHAYRTDIWEGYVPQVGINVMGGQPYTYEQVRLTAAAGGPFGCYPTDYVTVLSEGMDFTNTILSSSGYTQTIMGLIYDALWRVDPLDEDLGIAPDLAYDWTITPTVAAGDIQEGLKYTFSLYDNITWHDGTPFTSEDVQYSLMNIHRWGTYTAVNLLSVYRVDIPDDYTVEIYSNNSGYMEFTRATSVQILPKHIWQPYESSNFTWSPATPLDMSGTGSYKWVTRVTEQYIILDRNAAWHFAVPQPARTPCPPPPNPLLWVGIAVVVIVIIIIAGVYFFRIRK
ncbi:MAG: ABC transporter substrate-binding protein [Promethearchaeota archaeon]